MSYAYSSYDACSGTMGQETQPGITEKEQGSVYTFLSNMKSKSQVDKVSWFLF